MAARSPELAALGRTLRARRKELDFTQAALATAVGADRTYVIQLEKGATNPTYELMKALADALEMPLWELLRHAETSEG